MEQYNKGFIPIVSKDTFDKEIQMCRELNRKNSGRCNWGECNRCGVLPFLIKLHEGKLLETSSEINEFKEKIFK